MMQITDIKHSWTEKRLGELCLKIGSGATPKGGDKSYKKAGISLIRSQNILDFDFSKKGLAYIDDKQAKALANVEVKKNDVLINITGDSVARVCIVPDKILPARVNQHVAILRTNPKLLSFIYLKYFLLNPTYKKHLLTLANSGGTRNALTKGGLENLSILLPPLPEQKAIAAVLSSLDDKIELLREENKTLEDIAQTIFKEWFVNFNFPGATGKMVDSELGEIPEGWRIGKLEEILWLSYGKGLKTEERTGIGFPVYGSSGIVGFHNEYLVKGHGIIVGRKGTMGSVIWCDENFYPIDTTFYVEDKLGVNSLYFHYFTLKKYDFNKLGSDSAVPGLNRHSVHSIKTVIPSKDTIEKFNILAQSLFNKRKSNGFQINTLTAFRDTLLPQLMLGKVKVKNL